MRYWSETERAVISTAYRPSKSGCNDRRDDGLLDQIVSQKNMTKAYKRVVSNKGRSGIDKMTVEDLKPYLQTHWEEIKDLLLSGGYCPHVVRQVEKPKPNGGITPMFNRTSLAE